MVYKVWHGFCSIYCIIYVEPLNFRDMEKKKTLANILTALPIAVCFVGLLALNPVGFVLGGIGVLGVIGQVMLNKKQ